MFQKIFYSNNPLQFWIVILFGIFGLFISLMYAEQDVAIRCSIFPEWWSHISINPIAGVLVSYLSLFLTTFALMSISKEFGDVLGILLPSVVLTLFFNLLTPTFLSINSIVILPAFIFIIKLLVNIYETQRVFSELFYMGFISGVASMIDVEFIAILFIVVIGIIVLRPFYFKEYLVLLISFILPYIILDAVIFFFFDIHVLSVFDLNIATYKFDLTAFLSSLYPMVVFFIFSIFIYNRILNNKVELKKIKSRKIFVWINISILLLWMWIILTSNMLLIYLLALMLAVSFSVVMITLPKKIHAKLLLITLFILNIIIFVVL